MRSPGRDLVLDDSRPVWRGMLVFLVPLMLSNVLQAASATLASIFVGRMIGVRALAAISGAFPIQFFLISFLIGLGAGSSVLIGQAWGAQDRERVRVIAGTTVTATFALGVIAGLIGVVFTEPLLHLIGTPDDVFAGTVAYARVFFVALPFLFVYLAYATFLRGVGDARTPFLALIGSTVIGVAITPPLIAGWFGFPQLGVISPAVANTFASIVTLVAMLLYLRAKGHPLGADAAFFRHLSISWPTLKMIVRIGVPTGFQMVMVSLAEIAVISFVNHFGSEATAAYGAVNQVVSYVQFPAISIGITASIFGSQAIGARKIERLGKIVRAAVGLNYVIEGLLIGAVYLFAHPILRLFVTDERVVEMAAELLTITLWSYAIFGNSSVLSGLMRSSGTVLWPTLIGTGAIWLVEVPVAYVLSHDPRFGLRGVWIAYPVAFCTALVLQTAYYRLVWKRRPVTALVPAGGTPRT